MEALMKVHKLQLPLHDIPGLKLHPGDKVLLSGTLYTARDQAHRRLNELIKSGKPLPWDLAGSAIFYCGPSPVPPGKICGAIGPTTSARMDPFTPLLLEQGLKVMLGKGDRSPSVEQAIRSHKALYLVAVGGISALLAQHVSSFELFLWPELGAEAVYKMDVVDLPCYVMTV
jgi:fumarate hydratase subunit beta